jgi:hypothetical protein
MWKWKCPIEEELESIMLRNYLDEVTEHFLAKGKSLIEIANLMEKNLTLIEIMYITDRPAQELIKQLENGNIL